MTNPQPLQEREQNLIDLYSHCQLGMTPNKFYAKWDINHETNLVLFLPVSTSKNIPSCLIEE